MSGWSVGPVGQRLSIDGGFGGPMAPTDLTRVISGVAGWGRAETGGEDRNGTCGERLSMPAAAGEPGCWDSAERCMDHACPGPARGSAFSAGGGLHFSPGSADIRISGLNGDGGGGPGLLSARRSSEASLPWRPWGGTGLFLVWWGVSG